MCSEKLPDLISLVWSFLFARRLQLIFYVKSNFRFIFDFLNKLDSIVSCLATLDFIRDFNCVEAILSKSCIITKMIINIFCSTGQIFDPLHRIPEKYLLNQGPAKLCRNVEGRLVLMSIQQKKNQELRKVQEKLVTRILK